MSISCPLVSTPYVDNNVKNISLTASSFNTNAHFFVIVFFFQSVDPDLIYSETAKCYRILTKFVFVLIQSRTINRVSFVTRFRLFVVTVLVFDGYKLLYVLVALLPDILFI